MPAFARTRLLVIIMVTLLVGIGAFACGPSEDSPGDPAAPTDEKAGGTLVFGRLQEPETLDIHKTPWLDELMGSMHATLLYRAEDGGYLPGLAEDWEISDDEKEITLTLRDDVTFHDGEPFNAEAVRFTFERMTDPDMASPGAHNWGPAEAVEVIDEYTVKIVYSEVYARALESLTSSYLAPLSPAAVEEHGEDFGTNPVGAGPFKFERWDLGSEVVVVRNEDFDWGPGFAENTGAPFVERIEFRFIPDETARVTALETGELDLIAMAPPRDVLRFEEDSDFVVVPVMATGIVYFGINCSKPPWDDYRLRQAVAWGTAAREEIIETAFEGLAIPIYGHLAPHIHPGYYPEVEDISYKYDPEKTAEILEDLGYEMGSDGYFEKDGEVLELEEVWITDDPAYQRVAVVIQEKLAEAGIKMNIVQMDDATLFSRTHEGVHDGMVAYYGFQDPDILFYFFHTSRLDSTNRIHYQNPEIDDLLERGRAILDFDERFEIYREVQEILLEDAPWVPLLVREEPLIHSLKVNDLNVHPVTSGIIWNDMWITQ